VGFSTPRFAVPGDTLLEAAVASRDQASCKHAVGRLTSYFLTREKRDRLKKVAQPSIAYALFVYTCTRQCI